MKKKLSLIICAAMCLSLVGCSQPKDPYQQFVEDAISSALGNTDKPSSSRYEESSSSSSSREEYSSSSSKQEESKPEKADLTKYELLAQKFIQSVQKKDWTAVQSCLDIKKLNFITNEDLEWILPRTTLADLADSTGTITVKSSKLTDKDTMKYSVTCECDGKEYDVEVRLMDDNSYKVFWDEAIATNVTAHIPAGCVMTYQGTEYKAEDLETKYIYEKFKQPYYKEVCSLVRRPFKFTLTNALGDTGERTQTINEKGELQLSAGLDITSDRAKEIIKDAFEVYTTLYTDVVSKATDDKLLESLGSTVSLDYITTIRNVNSGGHYDYKFNAIELNKGENDPSVWIVGGSAFQVYVNKGMSGSYRYGTTNFLSSSFKNIDLAVTIIYEDGKAKFVNTYGNDQYMFRQF